MSQQERPPHKLQPSAIKKNVKKRGPIFQKVCIAYGLTATLKKCWHRICQSRGKTVKSAWVNESQEMAKNPIHKVWITKAIRQGIYFKISPFKGILF